MSKFLALALILVFIGVGSFEIFFMKSHSDCFLGNFGDCAENALSMIELHISVFSSLSRAVFGSLPLLTAVLFLLVLGLIGLFLKEQKLNVFRYNNYYLEKVSFFRKFFIRWLAIHENSPSFEPARI